jgi:hypothetical protein
VPSLRTAYSDTYDNHNGTYTATISTGPINYLPAGLDELPADRHSSIGDLDEY